MIVNLSEKTYNERTKFPTGKVVRAGWPSGGAVGPAASLKVWVFFVICVHSLREKGTKGPRGVELCIAMTHRPLIDSKHAL